jgi:hypothetical protein
MTFGVGKANIAHNAAGNWQLAAGKFSSGESCIFGTKLDLKIN